MSNENKKSGSAKLSDSIEDKVLKEAVASLEDALEAKDAEIAALKKVSPAGGSVKKEKQLSEKDRTFTAEWKDPDGKKKTGKFLLEDVSKIYVSGKKYTPAEFIQDTEVQAIVAAAGTHPNIKTLK